MGGRVKVKMVAMVTYMLTSGSFTTESKDNGINLNVLTILKLARRNRNILARRFVFDKQINPH